MLFDLLRRANRFEVACKGEFEAVDLSKTAGAKAQA